MQSFDLIAHLLRQRGWSRANFGPETVRGPKGPLAHLKKEIEELEEAPDGLEEWIDIAKLAFDGAMRAGYTPQQICQGLGAKQEENELRPWPNWRDLPPDTAVEHIRTEESQPERSCHTCAFSSWPEADSLPLCRHPKVLAQHQFSLRANVAVRDFCTEKRILWESQTVE
ncbi:MAG: DUF550 domain-containing protein [Epibacterium sp.]|nr:DUF550 domain-containing protein [Epibacterium sp.]MCJ8334457.1 DUF550 domain-containing protein [Epibacterium sp.]NQX73708.1 DUF550 domain-containing protein [Epibacterium sp.]NQX73767.1 DUF550 domain-containing protein [Epibacterium sp.]